MLENKAVISLQNKESFVTYFLKNFSELNCFVFIPSLSGPVNPKDIFDGIYNKSMSIFFDLCSASSYKLLPIFAATQDGCKEMLNYLINFNKNNNYPWCTHILVTDLTPSEIVQSVLKDEFHTHVQKDLDAYWFLSAYYANEAVKDSAIVTKPQNPQQNCQKHF